MVKNFFPAGLEPSIPIRVIKPDPDPHQIKIQKAVEAQNGCYGGLWTLTMEAWRLKMEPWRVVWTSVCIFISL
jgi:hypothetical protein